MMEDGAKRPPGPIMSSGKKKPWPSSGCAPCFDRRPVFVCFASKAWRCAPTRAISTIACPGRRGSPCASCSGPRRRPTYTFMFPSGRSSAMSLASAGGCRRPFLVWGSPGVRMTVRWPCRPRTVLGQRYGVGSAFWSFYRLVLPVIFEPFSGFPPTHVSGRYRSRRGFMM